MTSRREFIRGAAGLATASTIGLAGCIGTANNPESVATAMLEAVYDADQKEAFELSHRDGPAAERFSGQVFFGSSTIEAIDVTVTITEKDETSAIAQIDYKVDVVGEKPEPVDRTFELRTNRDDEWKVWTIRGGE